MKKKSNSIFWKKAKVALNRIIQTYGELGGTIGIGKSELLEGLKTLFGTNLIAFDEFYNKQKLEEFYENPEKNKELFQTFIRQERLNLVRKIKKIRKNPLKKNKLIIADRLMLGEMAFTMTNLKPKWSNEKQLILNKMKIIAEDSNIDSLFPDFVIMLMAPPLICKERIKIRGLVEELTIEESYLLDIQNSYKQILLKENILHKNANIFFIDYTHFVSPRDIICNILASLNITYFKKYMKRNNIKNCLLKL